MVSAPRVPVSPPGFVPLIDRAWAIYARALSAPNTATVQPSMPILYFGDLHAYSTSPVRIVTVGLNPSLYEFPAVDPWSRFPAAAPFDDKTSLEADEHGTYLSALTDYFTTDPYRSWFDKSFEPLLRGAGASYYPGARSTVLHTDIASPVATTPTWSKLGERHEQHRGGAELWRDLVEQLAPDVMVVSVARRHLEALTPLKVQEWPELMRIERELPFIVRETRLVLTSRPVLVVFGRCTNVPFGSVSFLDRERVGAAIQSRLAAMQAGESES